MAVPQRAPCAMISDAAARLQTGPGGLDLLAQAPPQISPQQAARIAAEVFGVQGALSPLTAEKDANFCIRPPVGGAVVLKITNLAEARGVTQMQTGALEHLARVAPDLPVPRVVPTLAGQSAQLIPDAQGTPHMVRLLTYLEGTVLGTVQAGPGLCRDIGALLAQLNRGLQSYDHGAAGHSLLWDIKQAGGLRPLLGAVGEDALRGRLGALLDRFEDAVAPRLGALPAQVVHNDFNPHNLLVEGTPARRLTGIIDFGDMVRTPVICDLAVACSYQITEGADPLGRITQMVAGYCATAPLSGDEIALLPDLIRLRHAASLVIGAWRAQRYPENSAYILRNAQVSRRGLAVLDQVGDTAARAALHRAAGVPE